jgi:opacity protein-like surface antigen
MKKFIVLIGLMFLLNPMVVSAQEAVVKKGAYVKAGAGFFGINDADLAFNYQGTDYEIGKIENDMGFNLHTAVGKTFSNGAAIELEFGYNESDADKFRGEDFSAGGVTVHTFDAELDAETSISTLMVNGLYNLKNSSIVTPYAGVGIGIGWAEIEGSRGEASGTNFAFQVLAGIDIALTDRLSLLTGYRYLDAGEISEDGAFYLTDGRYIAAADGEYSFDLQSHNFEAGLKYSF